MANRYLIFAAGLLGFAPQAMAQSAASDDIVVVTATRAPTPIDQVGSAVSIITGERLEVLQTVPIAEALRDLPGVGFNRNGGIGAVTSVRIRGAESEQTTFLIDGVKLNDPGAPGGGYDFANLLADSVQRIEVLRGPQSPLYGSQAIGGVVHVITGFEPEPFKVRARLEVGERNTRRASLAAGGSRPGVRAQAVASRFETDGFSARAGGAEADGYENSAVNARASFDVGAAGVLDLRSYWVKGEVDIDGFPPPIFAFADTLERSETEERLLHAGFTWRGNGGRDTHRIGLSRTDIDRALTDPTSSAPLTFQSEGVAERIDYQATLNPSESLQLIAGLEREEQSLRSRAPSVFDPNPPSTRAATRADSVYAQTQVRPVEGLIATVGARYTEDSRFGGVITRRATLAYAPPGADTVLRASIGEGFKAPTPFQLLSEFGNARLQPEESYAYDFGIEQRWFDGALTASVGIFRRETKNQIDFISCFANPNPICINRPFGVYDNVARTDAQGVEIGVAARPGGGWTVDANYTRLDARNRTPGAAQFDQQLPRRARDAANLFVQHQFDDGHEASVSVAYVGETTDTSFNPVRLPAYTVIGVRGSARISANISLTARVENVADERYQTALDYAAPPRQAFVGLRLVY